MKASNGTCHSGLTETDYIKLEIFQKEALGLILNAQYLQNRRYYRVSVQPVSYKPELAHCNLVSLKHHRNILILTSKFAIETGK